MLKIQNLKKAYLNNTIFDNFNLEIKEENITCIIGVSGIGKTTLLNIVSGLTAYDSGNLTDFKNRTFSYIFQEPRLLKWKTVFGNIQFILKDRFKTDDSIKITNKYLDLVGLKDFKSYYPNKLSGGMEQRVSIARAFAYPSDILIMDEPFKSLDYKLKKVLMKAFIQLWEEDRRTVVFVTHDIEEAAYTGSDIVILEENKPTSVKKILNIAISQKERLEDYNNIRSIKKQLIENL